ncbi:multifunctional tryptophan biosynthesis protein [Kwoniella dejecticola CBS 10117]|uniref:Multifunctional tryptophan biosynthesis protein n=1 Tax=Kwoniella dejecticola CBS 10117 TaxID=1296121 RepID=A0A1A6A478_9TREE|nr:anthranilate synthase/indole-3-glycerol phosphate synthase/phosphoribosylanthranilate isomerase [Kwoniella dejecticola CBS 10117]OBR84865.1 anthranilate synthase/indole-3-glycerol phosphate synthase/phosphoribosylanthranilate isomerase [Kwoniella dejecticola CBS 10117]
MGITLLIDNYDSFTWNVYADIAVLGGNPVVVRNDKVTLEQIEELYNSGELERIVISPGPGHPRTDSGISREAIRWGIGKLPILGVCMGLECIVDLLGGEIAYAGEIKHGKTSLVQHDSLGIFHDLPPLLSSVRYHSLSAQLLSVPPILQVTSTTQESGVIMGVRHREATVEAVQYHPESCVSEGGKGLMANFLKLKGGKWGGENAWCGVESSSPESSSVNQEKSSLVNGSAAQPSSSKASSSAPSLPTILNKIHAQRLLDVEESSAVLATTPANVSTSLSLHTSPPLLSLVDRINSTPHTAVMAEIKRASPSKGDIAPDASAPAQALKYALAGASVISVLTEPKWFKGSLVDMLAVRNAVSSLPNRPAILRKDFILSKYMIDEARLYGADTVLLIVAMLEPAQLKELYDYSVSIGMEPLVEVNNTTELQLALEIGSKVIGVNNRNLHDFNVDMSTTSRVNAALDGRDVILCALSGISGPEDVEKYVKEGVRAVLVGESLMRAKDTKKFLRSLIGLSDPVQAPTQKTLVKICGIRSVEDAKIAIGEGADLLGVILVPNAKRRITYDVAREISSVVRQARSSSAGTGATASSSSGPNEPWFTFNARRLNQRKKPLLVGVFQNQPLEEILEAVDEIGLDIVQLHGDEPIGWSKFIPVPTIKVFKVTPDGEVPTEISRPGENDFVLLDASGKGGEGKSFPWEAAKKVVEKGENGSEGHVKLPIILAGGLNPDNVLEAIHKAGGSAGVRVVDVSSGVEVSGGGKKDQEKVKAFIKAVKA